MKNTYKSFLLAIAVMLCIFGCAPREANKIARSPAQPEVAIDYMFCAKGVVISKGLAIEGVEVYLHIEGSGNDADPARHTITDSKGEYLFGLCCSGRVTPYSLQFTKAGFKVSTFEGSTSDCSETPTIELIPNNE
jgi:hypothetical protein